MSRPVGPFPGAVDVLECRMWFVVGAMLIGAPVAIVAWSLFWAWQNDTFRESRLEVVDRRFWDLVRQLDRRWARGLEPPSVSE